MRVQVENSEEEARGKGKRRGRKEDWRRNVKREKRKRRKNREKTEEIDEKEELKRGRRKAEESEGGI